MNDRLSLTQLGLLAGFAAVMAGGQLLFKLAAMRSDASHTAVEQLIDLLQNKFFLLAIILYGALSISWVWILSFTPLSRAYPFVALAFALTPLLGALVFAEPISTRLVIGLTLILGGLFFITG